MKPQDYWAARMETLNEAQLNKGEEYAKKMNLQYDKAVASIQSDIDRFYGRFAKNNNVDLITARQMLNNKELKELHWTLEEYIENGRQNALDQRWMKELENASIQVRMTRLQALQLQMKQHVEILSAQKQAGAHDVLGGIYKDNYYNSVFELQKGVGLGSSFAKLDKRQTEIMLATPWAPDGSNFSQRIWKDRDKLVHDLQTVLTQGLIRGETSDTMINNLMMRFDVSRSAAARLIITESAYFSGQSRYNAYKELGVVEYKILATLDLKTSSICRHMDGTIFKMEEMEVGVSYPPFHAHCRTTTIPHYEDNVKERAADADGETYDVPGDMKYPEWYNKYVKDEDEESERQQKKEKKTVLTVSPNNPTPIPLTLSQIPTSSPPVFVEKLIPTNTEMLEKQIIKLENSIRHQDIEQSYITTEKGEIYYVMGTKTDVNIAPLGDKLKNAVVTHNHPTIKREPGGSFSQADISTFFAYGLSELRAVDSSFSYKLKRTVLTPNLSEEMIGLLFLEAEKNYGEKLTIEAAFLGYDVKHLTMIELVTLIEGLEYERSPYDGD